MSHSEQFDAEDESTPVQPELAVFGGKSIWRSAALEVKCSRSHKADRRLGLPLRFQENRCACLELRNVERKASSDSARTRFKRSFNY